MSLKILIPLIIYCQSLLVLHCAICNTSAWRIEYQSTAGPSVFPNISGWTRTDTLEIYYRNNLYDHIDGAAEQFLKYDFQEVQVAEYKQADKASVIVEIYRFQTPLHAFGMYSQERPLNGSYRQIGVEAYMVAPILNFLAGNCYIKISSFGLDMEADSILQIFARAIEKKICGITTFPVILDCFPLNGKKLRSEKFFARDFLGYDFLHSGFTADYTDGNQKFQIFIIDGSTPKECQEMLKNYLLTAKSNVEVIQEGRYDFKDPNYGDVSLSWQGSHLGGILYLKNKDLRTTYLQKMEDGLKQGAEKR